MLISKRKLCAISVFTSISASFNLGIILVIRIPCLFAISRVIPLIRVAIDWSSIWKSVGLITA